MKKLITVFAVLMLWSTGSWSTVWKVQTLYHAEDLRLQVFREFAERTKVMTKGELEIEAYPRGELSSIKGAFSAVKHG